jgi:hypothetical protein
VLQVKAQDPATVIVVVVVDVVVVDDDAVVVVDDVVVTFTLLLLGRRRKQPIFSGLENSVSLCSKQLDPLLQNLIKFKDILITHPISHFQDRAS